MAINIERIIVFIIREVYIRLLQLFKRFGSYLHNTEQNLLTCGVGICALLMGIVF